MTSIMIFDTFLGDSEIPAKVSYNFSGGRPAKLNGPLEDCYPAEPPELEIEEVGVFGVDILDILSDETVERITDQALDHAINAAIDHDEIKADHMGDEQREIQHWDKLQGDY